MPEDTQMLTPSPDLKPITETYPSASLRLSAADFLKNYSQDLLLAQTEEKLSALSRKVFDATQEIITEINAHHQENFHHYADEFRKLERHSKEQASALEILKIEYENLISKINGLQKLLQSERSEKSKLLEQSVEQQSQLAAKDREITHLNNLTMQLQQKMNQAQKLHDEKTQSLHAENERLIHEKNDLTQQFEALSEQQDALTQTHHELTQKIHFLATDNASHEENILALSQENESLKLKVSSLSLELQNEHASYLAEHDRQKREYEDLVKKAELDAKACIATERQQFINQSKAQAAATAQQIKALEAAHLKALQSKEREHATALQKQKDSYTLGLEKRDYDHTQSLHTEVQKLKDAYTLTRNNELKKQAALLRKTQEESLASARTEIRAEYQEKIRQLEKRLAVLLEERALITAENKRKQKKSGI